MLFLVVVLFFLGLSELFLFLFCVLLFLVFVLFCSELFLLFFSVVQEVLGEMTHLLKERRARK